MYYLVKTAGLELSLYQGDLVGGVREGSGVQYFANGYKFTGEWRDNKANGIGRLDYTDGTFYEGTFKDNCITEGILSFYSGAKFIGKFSAEERQRARFQEGSFIFINGDMLKTSWKNGIPQSGNFITKEGKIFKFLENERAVFLDEADSSTGKIIMANSTEIYEGGIKEKVIHGKGIIYSSFPHYEEAFYSSGKPNGPYKCNYIHGGYCYEGNFKNGQRIGKWKYQTVRGFFYEGEANLKSGKVSFPYWNDDHFIGDVDIQFNNIILLNGTYNKLEANGKYQAIQVQNIQNLSEIPELKDRKFSQEDIPKRFQRSKVMADEPILNGIQIYNYPDGSYFKGNFNYDFIYIHKRDLLNCYFPANSKKMSKEKVSFSISNAFQFCQKKSSVEKIVNFATDEQTIFIGKKLNNIKLGFGKLFSTKHGFLQGLFKNNKLNGPGKRTDPTGEVYFGNFIDGIIEGPVIIFLQNGDIIKTSFSQGQLDQNRVILQKQNGLIYIGGIVNLKKEGHGELIYTNGYKYIGDFQDGEMDTSQNLGKIVDSQGLQFECTYIKVSNRELGILETNPEGEVFVYNSSNGSLKKAQ